MKIIITESQYRLILEQLDSESILFVGDSHSVDIPGYTYSGIFKSKNDNVNIIASEGKSTSWMKSKLKSELDKNKYDRVVIWGGNNDILTNVSINTIINNIQDMVDMVSAQGGEAYVIVGYDQKIFSKKGKYSTKYMSSEKMDELRDKYIEFQEQLPNLINGGTIIPSFKIDNSYTTDNIHGNEKAQKKIYDIVSNYLDEPPPERTASIKPESMDSETAKEIMDNINDYIEDNKTFKAYESGSIPYEPEVEDIQVALQFLGFSLPVWGVDGLFGPETKKAVMDFQDWVNTEPTGEINKNDLKNILKSLENSDFEDEDLSDIQTDRTDSLELFDSNGDVVIDNPGISISGYPSDLEKRFKNVVGDLYDDFIADVKSIGLDPITAMRQLYTESGFKEDVIYCRRKSSAGAMGIAQFMPGTWPSYGEGSPCVIENALKAYVKFMKVLLNKFPGRPDIAVAAYNSGPNLSIYKKALENEWDFTELKGEIPNETYKYASTIFQA